MGLLDEFQAKTLTPAWNAATGTLASPVNTLLAPPVSPVSAQIPPQAQPTQTAQIPSVIAANPLQAGTPTPRPDLYSSPLSLPKNYSIPQLPNDEEAIYRKSVVSPTTIPQPAGIQDIPGAVSAAYSKAGGGVVGVGMGALAGLGKLGEFISTKTGQQVMSGTTSNPWLGSAYVQGAENARGQEMALKQGAIQQNMEKMKAQGEDVRARNAQQADLIKQQTENAMTMPLKLAQLQNEYNRTGNESTKNQIDMINQQMQRQQEQERLGLEGRSTFDKFVGNKPAQIPSTQAAKQLNGENYIQVGGKWYKQ